MKNIHVLPTDKPSRLIQAPNDILILLIEQFENNEYNLNKHIYITSDETAYPYALHYNKEVLKIRAVGENSGELYHDKGFSYPDQCKKIILTTDQYLIKDGVQAINDEFLEWFVKNPSCEHVTILQKGTTTIIFPTPKNDIISDFIKKEESKQETLEEVGMYQQELFNYLHDLGVIALQSELQEIERIVLSMQQERMYSEEEIIKILIEYDYSKINDDKLNSVGIVKKWFKQFKKK